MDGDRPDFNRMIEAAKQKKFQIVLRKTQSRFTRDMELVEKYIHGLFPIWGVRFIAVADNADTEVKGNKKARQINSLINEWYLEDLSENIRMVFDLKRREGKYIGGCPLYGYQKDPADKHHIVPDPEAAEVVRQIFQLSLAGHGRQNIAALLNQQGVPNPTRYKAQLVIDTPEDQWYRVEGTHEAIIHRATFEAVQRGLHLRTRTDGSGQTHLLAGLVKCADCGSTMSKCSLPCHRETYDNEAAVGRMWAEQRDMRVPPELVPRCPRCGRPMAMNLRADHTFVQDGGWYAAARRYEEFTQRHSGGAVLYLSWGLG